MSLKTSFRDGKRWMRISDSRLRTRYRLVVFGDMLYSGSMDNTIKVWNLAKSPPGTGWQRGRTRTPSCSFPTPPFSTQSFFTAWS